MEASFLPNGTVVLLKGGNKKLMIYGRKQLLVQEEDIENETDDLSMYDYLGVLYPEGYIDQEHSYVFNHADISEVIFEGYKNEEEEAFQEVLKQA
ncbi:DUF4176 domain-containing protein [Virgibacillus halodenitrificans]|uniref:DUF4176 domain-containing protein n=1 Tax=Virgibacillus halodenitrificans TaxID=1482 RepID=UPI00031703DC|nr:DUF4176 domain-containing protein [Virgibacillus halodenitrificans]MCJ0930442.1 DUF4176 domain-containing protein [Virgibacillus halodenitrificans]MYL59781.1 DUF4176 domain-containing protein [Virgibacillus halodenitrificans]